MVLLKVAKYLKFYILNLKMEDTTMFTNKKIKVINNKLINNLLLLMFILHLLLHEPF